MKRNQISICIILSLIVYILASFVGLSFDPFKWEDGFGRFFFALIVFWIWVTPLYFNYMNGK